MVHNTALAHEVVSPDAPARRSTSEEQAEFLSLVRSLGIQPKQRQGWQPARCWNRAAHAHGDKRPSLSLNLGACWFHCHACQMKGGLVEARRHAGQERPERGRLVSLDEIARCADFDVDPLRFIPQVEIDALRARTGRHKLDRALTRNLRLLIAAAVRAFDQTGKATGVRFTSADAMEAGIRPQVFTDLVRLLPWFGIDVEVGESGRTCSKKALNRKRPHLKATVIQRKKAKTYYSFLKFSASVSSSPAPSFPHLTSTTKSTRLRRDAVIAAGQAVKTESKSYGSLRRSHAVAALLADLDSFRSVIPASGGSIGRTGSRTIEELVNAHGPSVRRTIRKAELKGLVVVVRSLGTVTLTRVGERVLRRDVENGREREATRAAKIRENWKGAQESMVARLSVQQVKQWEDFPVAS